jgi:hypothetical protein
MTPYAVTSGHIPEDLVKLFKIIRRTFEELPDFEGELITCHAICSAFAERYNLTCVDGYFGKGDEHSWLIDQKHPEVIMDIYPVGGASSCIIYKHWLTGWANLYIKMTIDIDTTERERQVQKILSVITRNEYVEKT